MTAADLLASRPDRRMTIRPGDLAYVPHGGKRIGKVVAIVDSVRDGTVVHRRWQVGGRRFGPARTVPAWAITEFVPATDRRAKAARKAMEEA